MGLNTYCRSKTKENSREDLQRNSFQSQISLDAPEKEIKREEEASDCRDETYNGSPLIEDITDTNSSEANSDG